MIFRAWLEAIEGYHQQIQDAVVQYVKDHENMEDDEKPEEILNKSLKMWGYKELLQLLNAANRKNFDEDRLKSIAGNIKSEKNAEFTVQQVIEALDSDEKETSMNVDKGKTYAPKASQNIGSPQMPQTNMPAAGPAPSAAPPVAMNPPQL